MRQFRPGSLRDRRAALQDRIVTTEAQLIPPTLHIRLLGDCSMVNGYEPVAGINTPRLHSLLAYLLLHRDAPQLRQHLAFLFWPDTGEAQARANLRQLIHEL